MQISGTKRITIVDPARLHTAYPCVQKMMQLQRTGPGTFTQRLTDRELDNFPLVNVTHPDLSRHPLYRDSNVFTVEVCARTAWHVHGTCTACAWRVHGTCMACACACACAWTPAAEVGCPSTVTLPTAPLPRHSLCPSAPVPRSSRREMPSCCLRTGITRSSLSPSQAGSTWLLTTGSRATHSRRVSTERYERTSSSTALSPPNRGSSTHVGTKALECKDAREINDKG